MAGAFKTIDYFLEHPDSFTVLSKESSMGLPLILFGGLALISLAIMFQSLRQRSFGPVLGGLIFLGISIFGLYGAWANKDLSWWTDETYLVVYNSKENTIQDSWEWDNMETLTTQYQDGVLDTQVEISEF